MADRGLSPTAIHVKPLRGPGDAFYCMLWLKPGMFESFEDEDENEDERGSKFPCNLL